jgi:hypothetical protein
MDDNHMKQNVQNRTLADSRNETFVASFGVHTQACDGMLSAKDREDLYACDPSLRINVAFVDGETNVAQAQKYTVAIVALLTATFVTLQTVHIIQVVQCS